MSTNPADSIRAASRCAECAAPWRHMVGGKCLCSDCSVVALLAETNEWKQRAERTHDMYEYVVAEWERAEAWQEDVWRWRHDRMQERAERAEADAAKLREAVREALTFVPWDELDADDVREILLEALVVSRGGQP